MNVHSTPLWTSQTQCAIAERIRTLLWDALLCLWWNSWKTLLLIWIYLMCESMLWYRVHRLWLRFLWILGCCACCHLSHLFLLEFSTCLLQHYLENMSLIWKMLLRLPVEMLLTSHRTQVTQMFSWLMAKMSGTVSWDSTYEIDVVVDVHTKDPHKHTDCSWRQKGPWEGRKGSDGWGNSDYRTWRWPIGRLWSDCTKTCFGEIISALRCPVSRAVWYSGDEGYLFRSRTLCSRPPIKYR